MADDIVERLRDRSVFDNFDLMEEAADEIERLRKAQEQQGMFFIKIGDRGYYVCESIWREFELLRKDVKTAIMGDSAELRDAKKEIERLREALKPFADYYKVPTFEEQRAAKAALEGK